MSKIPKDGMGSWLLEETCNQNMLWTTRVTEIEVLTQIANPLLQGRPRSEMTVEERIAAADRRRVDGNDAFKGGQIKEALKQYEMVRPLLT
jgi:hypothetical protein